MLRSKDKGFGLIAAVIIISLVLLNSILISYVYFYEVNDELDREADHFRSEIAARACFSRAFARYLGGLTDLPHHFWIESSGCDFISVSVSGDNVSLAVIGEAGSAKTEARATFSKSRLTLISYSL